MTEQEQREFKALSDLVEKMTAKLAKINRNFWFMILQTFLMGFLWGLVVDHVFFK